MSNKIVKCLKHLNELRKERNTFMKWAYKKLPKNIVRIPLSAEQKKAVDAVWGPYRYKAAYGWHELYSQSRGMFSPEYVPSDVFYPRMLPKLNDLYMYKAWVDKSYAPLFFAGLPQTNTVVECIDGRLYDSSYEPVTAERALEILCETSSMMIVKPSKSRGQGAGVSKFEVEGQTGDTILEMCRKRGDNCVFQEPVRQSRQLAALNKDSVNIMRINSLRLGDEIHTLNVTIRFGIPGLLTDVGKDKNGKEVLNLLGIDKAGNMMDKVFHNEGDSEPVENYGFKAGTHLEGIEDAVALTKAVHKRLHHFDFVGFDVTIDENNRPLLIEANLAWAGIYAYQFVHGPLFGEHLPAVLDYCFGNIERKNA